jgi:hypothetical protein
MEIKLRDGAALGALGDAPTSRGLEDVERLVFVEIEHVVLRERASSSSLPIRPISSERRLPPRLGVHPNPR